MDNARRNMNTPNIVLILMDQLSLHAVSCYGAPICNMPNIDALAAGGARLVRDFAEATGWTYAHWLAKQMHHTPWHGFRFLDLVHACWLDR